MSTEPEIALVAVAANSDDDDALLTMHIDRDGNPSYFVADTADADSPEVEVSAEVWRDVARLKSLQRLRRIQVELDAIDTKL
jgi:hypothetical protein